MSLQTTIEEIRKMQALASEDLSDGELTTLNARRGRKNQAIERLKQLKRDYTRSLMTSAVFILVTGDSRSEYTKMAEEDFGLFAADSEGFYKDLTRRIPQTLYINKTGITNVFDVLGRHLEDKMSELDVNEYNQLLYKAGYGRAMASEADLREVVKRAINEQIGAEVVGIQAVNSIVDKAIETSHVGMVTPIVLQVDDPKLLTELRKDLKRISKKIFVVSAGETKEHEQGVIYVEKMNKTSVEKSLAAIKKTVKK